jgi:23S rRNA U2552 (ribose-2'-O)-methylase RlmE/FtsJ
MSQGLREIFETHRGRDIFKWEHFFAIYERHCSDFVSNGPTVLEFGVMRGGSLQLWLRYFGEGASIHGVDINPRCKEYEEPGISVHIGDQSDDVFLREICERFGPFDVVIDDGSHQVEHQKQTLETLWPFINEGGVYVCEDTHTSYFTRFGGGYRRNGTFIERAKDLVDSLHMWWSGRMSREQTAAWTPYLAAVHFYPACLVLEKTKMEPPNAIWNEGGALKREPAKSLQYSTEQDPVG